MKPLRWGVLGTGVIAGKFAGQLKQTSSGTLVATGSRTAASAQQFSTAFGGRAHASYEALLSDSEVEAVYVSLPNHLHHEWTLKALDAGKHVLCEKPLAANRHQAAEMFAAAERHQHVLVEAFMYRCKPSVREFLRRIHSGAIGEVRLIRSHFTFNRPASDTDARYHSQMAGGSLMDVGCYCVNFSRAIANEEPLNHQALAHLHASGVDDYAAGLLRFPNNALGSFTCGMTVESDRTTFVGGSEGWMSIDFPWLDGESFVIVRGDSRETVTMPSPKPIYALEADAFAACVHEGTAPWISKEDTLGNMCVLDELRRQVGVPVET